MTPEAEEHKAYSRREIAVIIAIIVVAAIVIGNFNTSTSAVESASAGPLTISLNVTCTGFGEPTYWQSLDPYDNVTTYQYGFCLFGFWIPNGHPVGAPSPTTGTGLPID